MTGDLVLIGWCGTCGGEIRVPSFWTGSETYPTWHREEVWNAKNETPVFVCQQKSGQPACYERPHNIIRKKVA